MPALDGRKSISLWATAVLAGLSIVVTAGCGERGDVTEPVAAETIAPLTAAVRLAPTVAVVELVQATATPYSQSVPSPVVVTATPAVELPEPISAQDIDCGDFGDWIEAQEFFLWNGGPGEDPNLLDTDMDGITCNAQSDRGYEFRVFASGDIPPPTPVVAQPTAVPVATPTVVVAATPAVQPSPTEIPTATAVPAVTTGDWPAPEEIGAIDLDKFKERGYFYKFVRSGRTIHVYESPKSTREVTCGPEIGTASDRSNPTWSETSHWIYVWSVKVGWGSGSCLGISKYEDWVNKSLPAAPLSQKEIEERRVVVGDPLEFASDDSDRSYSLPPYVFGLSYPQGTNYSVRLWALPLDDEWVVTCNAESLPWAWWGKERGFWTISIKDEEAYMRGEWTEEQLAMKKENRRRGWYYIRYAIFDEGPKEFCWHVPNHKEIPTHRPCLECQWRVQ